MRRFFVSVLAIAMCAGCGAAATSSGRPFGASSATTTQPRSVEAFHEALRDYDAATAAGAAPDALAPLIDRVARLGAQRDAHVSRLYWHTDLAEAVKEAKKRGRPILSLRMLGRLDEELSCANSRFFRTTLYSNGEVSRFLRGHFVLHWSSERPVPTVTIDYGDGRKVVRTITGNSIHYVLDAKGRPIDALPGLYEARAFLDSLAAAEPIARLSASSPDDERRELLVAYHRRAEHVQNTRFSTLATNAGRADLRLTDVAVPSVANPGATSALVAVNVAATKAVVERPTLGALGQPLAPRATEDTFPDDAPRPWYESFAWGAVAKAAPTHVTDASTLALMRAKNPREWSNGKARLIDDAGFSALVRAFEQSLAVDTLKNEFGIHRALHAHFAERPDDDLDALNRYVYDALFLTPASDPWLGLMPPRAFTGLPDDGFERAR